MALKELSNCGPQNERLRHGPAGLGVGRVTLVKMAKRVSNPDPAGRRKTRAVEKESAGLCRLRSDTIANRNKFHGSDSFSFLAEMEKQEFKIRGFGFRSEEALLDDGKSLVSTGPATSGSFGTGRQSQHSDRFVWLAPRSRHAPPVPGRAARKPFRVRRLRATRCPPLANQFVRDASQQASAVTASSVGVHTSTIARRTSASSARSTISREAAPPIRATRPTPQASWSVVRGLGLIFTLCIVNRARSTIENFDGTDGFFGQWNLYGQGH